MISFRQFEANRRNALKSTGPRTEEGKRRSRRNAVRHGLTAETVIASLEEAEDYKAFEAAVIADYDGQTAVERELVLRLASLLWQLQRGTAIETQLLEIQAVALRKDRHQLDATPQGQATSYCSVHHFPRPPLHRASLPRVCRLPLLLHRLFQVPRGGAGSSKLYFQLCHENSVTSAVRR
jgi:hypothetical protein